MKFYVTVTCQRIVEIEVSAYEEALVVADKSVTKLLPERSAWKSQVEVSAVVGCAMWPRYYVQILTETNCQVKERQLEHQNEQAGIHPDDPVIRSFKHKEDAHDYADSMSTVQEKLDRQYGRWTRHAISPEIAVRS